MENDRALNMVMLGAMVAVTGIVSEGALAKAVESVLEGKKRRLIEINQEALAKGAQFIS
jgi:Pyruvate/2-oxoacid:ferredoxin oxidoreductase gamma subunit